MHSISFSVGQAIIKTLYSSADSGSVASPPELYPAGYQVIEGNEIADQLARKVSSASPCDGLMTACAFYEACVRHDLKNARIIALA